LAHSPLQYRPVIRLRLENSLLIFIAFIFLSTNLAAQTSKKDLENKKKKLQDEISNTNKLLEATRNSKNLSIKELNLLNNKIGQRQNLINTLSTELSQLNAEMNANQHTYDSLQTALGTLKKEFARIVNYTYKFRNQNSTLSYLLTGEDFNKAYKRAKYLDLYSKYRKAQALKIQELQKQLLALNDQIVANRSTKIVVINQNENQKKELTGDKLEQEKIVKKLQKTETELKAQIKKKQGEANKLQNAIKKIIEDEIKKSAEVPKKATSGLDGKGGSTAKIKTPVKTETITLTPEAKLTSQNFESNKGRLPWPVEKGFISSSYGAQPHPVLTGITINNNGVDISTDKGATARAVFDGEVSGVINIPGAGQAIIIRHGDYLSVYANLSSVSVAKGSKVKAKQSIGIVGYNNNDGSVIHLEIWKGKTKLNPAGWIAAR